MTRLTTVQSDKVETATEGKAVVRETPVQVNQRGFMTDPSQWTPGAAWFLARRQGLTNWPGEFTADHWRVIDYTRTYYEATDNAPSLRYTCRALGLTKKRFSRLFPGGLMTVRRISGLPGPRRSANSRELSIAQQLLTGDWWERLTHVDLPKSHGREAKTASLDASHFEPDLEKEHEGVPVRTPGALGGLHPRWPFGQARDKGVTGGR